MKKIIVCVMMLVATGAITSVNAQSDKKDRKCTKTEQCGKKCDKKCKEKCDKKCDKSMMSACKDECGQADSKGCKAEKCNCKKDQKETTPKKM